MASGDGDGILVVYEEEGQDEEGDEVSGERGDTIDVLLGQPRGRGGRRRGGWMS